MEKYKEKMCFSLYFWKIFLIFLENFPYIFGKFSLYFSLYFLKNIRIIFQKIRKIYQKYKENIPKI